MNSKQREVKIRKSTKTIVIGIVFIVVFLFTWRNYLGKLDNYAGDIVYQRTSAPELPITIVKIDDSTINRLGQYSEWDRSVYADLIGSLCTDDSSPSVIAFDIVFSGNKSEEGDRLFAEAVDASPAEIVLGTYLYFDERIVTGTDGKASIDRSYVREVSLPYDELTDSDNVLLGFTNNQADEYDGYMRTCIAGLSSDGVLYKSFPYSVLRAYSLKTGTSYEALSSGLRYRFSYSGGPGTFDTVSMIDVLDGRIPASNFKDRIVLVGAYTSGFGEEFYSPAAYSDMMYGVEINAHITEAMALGRLQTNADLPVLALIYGAVTAALLYVMFSLDLFKDAILCISVLCVHIVSCKVLFGKGIYVNPSVLWLAVVLSFIGMITFHYVAERSIKQKISKAFKLYVAPQIVDEVASRGEYRLELGGRTKDIAVLFVDIRGFTSMSENLQPEEVVGILNEYFEIITNAVFKNNGTIDKFIGDAAMAVFNSPFDLDDYVFRAVCTAWDIAEGSMKLSPILMEKFGRTVSYGIGVNCGPAVIGNMGSKFRMDYTAIGDTVNTSSRLESNAKAGQILISQEVKDRLGERIETEEIGVIPLKGKKIGINVFNVTAVHRDSAN